jgi:hypothetical protein
MFREQCLEKWRIAASVTFTIERLFASLMEPMSMLRTALKWLKDSNETNIHRIFECLVLSPVELSVMPNAHLQLFDDCTSYRINPETLSHRGQSVVHDLRSAGVRMFHTTVVSNVYNVDICYQNFCNKQALNAILIPWRIQMLRFVCHLLLFLSYQHNTRSKMLMFIYRQLMTVRNAILHDVIDMHDVFQRSRKQMQSTLYQCLGHMCSIFMDNARQSCGELDVDATLIGQLLGAL